MTYPDHLAPDGPASYSILPPSPEWRALKAEILADRQERLFVWSVPELAAAEIEAQENQAWAEHKRKEQRT